MQQAAAARLSAVESSLRGGDAPDDLLPELRSASGSRYSDGAADVVTIERQRRQLLEARLAAQMEANAALRRDNLELASHLTATSQQLRAALRSRDELRRQTAEAASVDKAIREAVSRRALQASQALCASLRARVSTLEEQVGAGAQSLRSRWTPQGAPPYTLVHTSIPLRKRTEQACSLARLQVAELSRAAPLPEPAAPLSRPERAARPAEAGGESDATWRGVSRTPPRQPAAAAACSRSPMTSPNAALLAGFIDGQQGVNTPERQVLLNLTSEERTAVMKELLALAAGLVRPTPGTAEPRVEA